MQTKFNEANLTIRDELEQDYQKVFNLNQMAFGQNSEAELVDKLRQNKVNTVSLVAEADKETVGHIMLSEMHTSDSISVKILGLAPMAVHPDCQQKGIGSKLVYEAISRAKSKSIDAIFVLGYPTYYPKFGFQSAKQHNIVSEYDVPDDTFMVLSLSNNALEILSGKTVRYSKEFSEL